MALPSEILHRYDTSGSHTVQKQLPAIVGEPENYFVTFFSGAMTVTRFCNPDWVFGHDIVP